MGRRVVGFFAVLVLTTLVAVPAHAQGATEADCTISVPVHFSPGVTMDPASGTQTSGGESGSIRCTGTFDGHHVTGTGSFGYEGVFTRATCLLDEAPLSGRYSFSVPTEAGPLRFAGTITDARVGLVDRFRLSQPGAQFNGLAVIVPAEGDCFLAPMADIRILVTGSFRGGVR